MADARAAITALKAQVFEPATLLHVDRVEQIVGFAQENSLARHSEQVLQLFQQERVLDDYVKSSRKNTPTSFRPHDWQERAEQCSDANEKVVRKRMWMEGMYHHDCTAARAEEDSGNYLSASEHYKRLVDLRDRLTRTRPTIVEWLHQLYGDPNSDRLRLSDIKDEIASEEKVEDLFRQGLQVIGLATCTKDELSSEKLQTRLAFAVRQYPGCEPLFDLYHLLAAEAVRRKYADSASLLAMQTLADERKAWEAMLHKAKTRARDGSDLPARLWTIVQELEKPVAHQLEDRQAQLRMAMLQMICVQPVSAENKEQETNALSLEELLDQDSIHLKMLVDGYHEVFPGDSHFSDKLKRCIDEIKEDIQRWHGDLAASAFVFDENKANRALLWAKRGELMAPVLGQEWDQELTERVLRERFREYNRRVNERNYRKGCLLSPFGGKKKAHTTAEEW